MRELTRTIEVKIFGIPLIVFDEWTEMGSLSPQDKIQEKPKSFQELFPKAVNLPGD